MRFDIITLFPELFEPFLKIGITRRAYESGLVDVRLWNPRDTPKAITAVSMTAPLAAALAWS